MKFRLSITAAVLVCLAAVAVADLSREYIDWGQGPLQFLMTKEEAAQWKTLRTDAEAKAFVDLFWARRDPTPGTPRNEYREQIELRIAQADKNLAAGGRVRGAMTDRGQAWILYGPPKRIERSTAERTPGLDVATGGLQRDERTSDDWMQWIYEGDEAKAVFLVPRATIRFVDRMGIEDYKVEPGNIDLAKARERAIARSITQPDLKTAPIYTAEIPASEIPVAPPEQPAVATELTTEAFQSAVAEGKSTGAATWGEFVTSFGEYYVPVGLHVPKASGVSGTDATFFGVVKDASGKNVLAFEEAAKLIANKDDFFVDKSLTGLPAGKYRGTFGVAQNGKVIALASTDMELAGTLDKDAPAASRLILSNNVYPLPEAQKPNDPFAFGGLKVVPRADLTFRTSDELWYFVELRNPGIAEPVVPEGQVPLDPAAVKPAPKIQIKMDVVGTTAEGKPVKMGAAPREAEAIELRGVPGHFGIGNAMPPSTFKPGDYTFTVKVIDTIRKTSYTLSEKFKVIE